MTDEQFLEEYDSTQYEKPSVTADALIFTMNENQKLEILLVKRNSFPYVGKWSFPGSFIKMNETPEETALRALEQKTGITDVYLEQLYTFAAIDRDPRMRIIAISYIALIAKNKLKLNKQENVAMFEINISDKEIKLRNKDQDKEISFKDLAFDHGQQLCTALERLKGKIDYSDIAFELLTDKNQFTIYELKKIHEAILNKELDTGNFRRTFMKKYIDTGKVVKNSIVSTVYSNKPSTTYKVVNTCETIKME